MSTERQFKSLYEIQILFAILLVLLLLLFLIIRLVWEELKEGKRIKTDDRKKNLEALNELVSVRSVRSE